MEPVLVSTLSTIGTPRRYRFDYLPNHTHAYSAMALFQAVLLSGLAWVLWKVFRNYSVRASFDVLPGPSPESFCKGITSPLLIATGTHKDDNL